MLVAPLCHKHCERSPMMQRLTALNDQHTPQLSLLEFMQKVIAEAEPLSQNTAADNLGFGWIYYALIRNLAPDFAVAIGSCRGFMPFCAARAMKDNGSGHVIFIDPSYS